MDSERVTVYRASELCGVSRDKIKRLIREGLVKKGQDNKISLSELRAALKAEEEAREELTGLDEKIKQATLKYREEKAKMAELERRLKEGKLIEISAVERLLYAIAMTLKKQILSWREKFFNVIVPYIPESAHRDVARVIDESIDELLDTFASNAKHKPECTTE